MKFNKLIEDFNISPQPQNAIQSGPDAGITTGNPNDTFPSHMNTIGGRLLPSETQFTLSKKNAVKLLKVLILAIKED